MKHNYLTIVLTILMSMAASVASAHDFEVDGIYYRIISSSSPYKVAVTYQGSSYYSYDNEYTGSVNIPESVTYNSRTYSVTSIDNYAFYACTGLTSVTIPNSVTSIGSYAFSGCSGLTSVTIPNSVTSIGSYAFLGCSGLTSITIPNSVTSIRESAFQYCSGLTSVTIPNSVTTIGNYAFSGCSGLTSVTIPNSVTSIGWYAFSWCMELETIVVNSGNTVYDSREGCNAIIETASNTLIVGCKNTNIPNSVTSIGNYAFMGCTGLTSITIPNSVTSIGSYAFLGCSGLTSITINSNAIASKDFNYKSSLASIFGDQVQNYTFGEDVTKIGQYACSNLSALKSVTIGSGITEIASSTFYNTKPAKVIWLTNTPPTGYNWRINGKANYVPNNQYSSLNNMTIYPYLSSMFEVDGVKYVPVSPSERTCDIIDCSYDGSKKNLVISPTTNYRNVTMRVCNIQPYAFYNIEELTSLTINNQGTVGEGAFSDCENLESISVAEDCEKYDSRGNCNAVIEKGTNKLVVGCKNTTIPADVTAIGNYAFAGTTGLTSINIPENVTSIGNGAFAGCSALTAFNIGTNVTNIGNYAFEGCKAVKDIVMEDGNSTLKLGSNGSSALFADCPLDSVYVGRNISYSTGSSYGYSPFYGNQSLRSIHITDAETEVSANEFYGCTNLKNVRLGNGITKIGDWAFSGCSSLDYFLIGKSTKNIGKEAFSDCTAMTRFISRAATPPTCGSTALDDINKWTCTLEVPVGSLSAYQGADQWKEFFFIEETTGVKAIDNEQLTIDNVYDLSGRQQGKMQRGVNLLRMSDGTTKKVLVK